MWITNNDIEIQLSVLEQGIALDAIPDPESFEDIFHYNFDAQGIWLGLVIGLGFACLFLFLRLIKNLRSLS